MVAIPRRQATGLLTVGQAATLLNVHENTVRRWAEKGLLREVRIGPRRDRRFEVAEVQGLAQREAAARAPLSLNGTAPSGEGSETPPGGRHEAAESGAA